MKALAILGGVPVGGKPETVMVLNDDPQQPYRVLVLTESIENANPLEYRVPRP